MNICVYGASSDAIDREYITTVEKMGEEMASRGHNLVYGAGAQGLMGAAARGVTKGGGKIIGVSPSFFKVDGVLYDKCTEMIFTETMRERKQIMEERSDAFVMTPGGVGTFEEFFEILTLKQLNRHQKAIAVLNLKGYYDDIAQLMTHAAAGGFMKEETLNLYKFFTDYNEMLDYLEAYKPHNIDIKTMKHIG
ncbi:MAG: TIGR00730 family Rossman fold protein [Clostridiales bacterium]|nr:TIGR00730 family Rossman fold protein [Clostridiales bacterium]